MFFLAPGDEVHFLEERNWGNGIVSAGDAGPVRAFKRPQKSCCIVLFCVLLWSDATFGKEQVAELCFVSSAILFCL